MDINTHSFLGSGLCLIAILFLQIVPMPRQQVAMLDVGQGDSILLQDGTAQVLIDGGPGAQVLQRLGEELPWFDRTIEIIIATHFDRDHVEGLTHVLGRYNVGMVLLPRHSPTTDVGRQFVQQLIDNNIPHRFGWYGQVLTLGGMQFRTMSPIPGSDWERIASRTSNNASIIMRADVTQGENVGSNNTVSLLLTGDAEKGIEAQLLDSVPTHAFNVDILKVGHHGSKTSTSAEFFTAASPSVSLLSVGADNTYGHPTAEVLQRLRNTHIFRTDQNGTISFFFDGISWRVRCGNGAPRANARGPCNSRASRSRSGMAESRVAEDHPYPTSLQAYSRL